MGSFILLFRCFVFHLSFHSLGEGDRNARISSFLSLSFRDLAAFISFFYLILITRICPSDFLPAWTLLVELLSDGLTTMTSIRTQSNV